MAQVEKDDKFGGPRGPVTLDGLFGDGSLSVASGRSVERQLAWCTIAPRHIWRSTVECTYAPKVRRSGSSPPTPSHAVPISANSAPPGSAVPDPLGSGPVRARRPSPGAPGWPAARRELTLLPRCGASTTVAGVDGGGRRSVGGDDVHRTDSRSPVLPGRPLTG